MAKRLNRLMTAAAMGGLLALAACQSQTVTRVAGEGAVDSATGVTYLQTIRSEHGLPPLRPDAALGQAALQQATYMAQSGKMNHTTGRGRDFSTRLKDNGVPGPAAENIAQGAMDPAKLFSMWMNSDGHRRNMLDPRFTKFGLAYMHEAKGSDKRYWALVLGR
ncbi:CAP domain-containing protein [Mesorhizobium sp. ANAO-SY3R2]|uniref:CAP domain-containing protein n=1 Tax=Mesorhizobium sp. ANAO-SY3R2 TaxID=3166644 RepID=UPI003672C2A4